MSKWIVMIVLAFGPSQAVSEHEQGIVTKLFSAYDTWQDDLAGCAQYALGTTCEERLRNDRNAYADAMERYVKGILPTYPVEQWHEVRSGIPLYVTSLLAKQYCATHRDHQAENGDIAEREIMAQP